MCKNRWQIWLLFLCSILLSACVTGRRAPGGVEAVESAVPGLPVPRGSVEQGRFDGGGGVMMFFYSHPGLEEGQVLWFFEAQMPAWGWTPIQPATPQPRQLSFEREGVPVLIGVEAAEAAEQGVRFSIIRGARGDWGFMPQMREPQ